MLKLGPTATKSRPDQHKFGKMTPQYAIRRVIGGWQPFYVGKYLIYEARAWFGVAIPGKTNSQAGGVQIFPLGIWEPLNNSTHSDRNDHCAQVEQSLQRYYNTFPRTKILYENKPISTNGRKFANTVLINLSFPYFCSTEII